MSDSHSPFFVRQPIFSSDGGDAMGVLVCQNTLKVWRCAAATFYGSLSVTSYNEDMGLSIGCDVSTNIKLRYLIRTQKTGT